MAFVAVAQTTLRVRVGGLVSDSGAGTFAADSVERIFAARRAPLARCARQARDAGEHVLGPLEVGLTIHEAGTVDTVAVTTASTPPELAACVVRVVQGFRFSPGPLGGDHTFVVRGLVEIDRPAPPLTERAGS